MTPELESRTITIEQLHAAAGVPEGAELVSYEWVDGGMRIHFSPPAATDADSGGDE